MSKTDQLFEALKEGWQPAGQLAERLAWQPHTMRGAISTLAKRHGIVVERRRVDGVTSYRIPTLRDAAE